MVKLTGADKFVAVLNRLPFLGRFIVSFFPEWRRRRVEDAVYLGKIQGLLAAINGEAEKLRSLSDEQLRDRTVEFRRRLREGFSSRIAPHLDELRERLRLVGKPDSDAVELVAKVSRGEVDHLVRRTLKELEDGKAFLNRVKAIEQELLDELLVEAFATVKEACRRHVGQSWESAGSEVRWDMVPFDVQLAGAAELHHGAVVEMATGEGKTLVALFPLYLNALLGWGVHLVTVNDYLSRRDSQWMGRILEYLGLTVGCIDLSNPGTPERRAAYQCDVTYGTNNEFGFDYLRDNMAHHRDASVQRGHHFAIIDEVDSILIDEARTPLIISGPVDRSTHQYDRLKPLVSELVRKQNALISEIATEAQRLLDEGRDAEAGEKLMFLMKGAPKHPRAVKLFQEPRNKKLMTDALNRWTIDKRFPELDDILHFIIDEKGHTIDLTERGRVAISPNNPEMFVLIDLVDEIARIDAAEPDPARKAALKEEARRRHEERSEELHNISQLLRAYMLYEKDVEYVVQDNKVIIVDEYTGRLMHGRRWSDGLHQAVEAKEGVKIERETQTLATITIQNYFRMYGKLAGMTGTAETEAGEFDHIYKMRVQRVPTNRPVQRQDLDDVIYKTKREKYNAIIEEIEWIHSHGMPVLVGTTSVEDSETLARMLRRGKVSCNVLNAKQHQREAEIIRGAGQRGAITIATNMAGRGTDIKLGPDVIRCEKRTDYAGPRCPTCPWRQAGDTVDDDLPPCGLHVIGSARHESRRIDRQLRGRSGRQGDPGASQFFLSFEDELLRLFMSERAVNMVLRLGKIEEGEEIRSGLITRQIGKAQSKVEAVNFDRRKKTLEYDDVMNRQREVIYSRRAQALFASTEECRSIVLDTCAEVVESAFLSEYGGNGDSERADVAGFIEWIQRTVASADFSGLLRESAQQVWYDHEKKTAGDELLVEVMRRIGEAYDKKVQLLESFGPGMALRFTQFVVLQTIDTDWRDHLLAMDELRQGIGLRGYAQVNPLHEYQKEAFNAFEELLTNINREIFERWFRMQIAVGPPPPPAGQAPVRAAVPRAPGGVPASPMLARAIAQR
ncbi:MAG: preprotein translocase subunit SecA, partial [Candidatus Sumerlaeia bacterium]|nr:preprotein translocase subunit SecA [Candidatus Sumerlaeia bacterium]